MAHSSTQYFNRYTRRLETEAVYGDAALRFVYGNPLGKLALHAVVKRAGFSAWYGRLMDRPASRKRIVPFIEKYGVDVSEFADPVESFATFNEFFVRRLKPAARPVHPHPASFVFPADGRHLAIPDLSRHEGIWVKGVAFDLKTLLGDEASAARHAAGGMLISRLCPTDYHRFHFPCAGVPGAARGIGGPLYSVNPRALLRRPAILWENKRFVAPLRTDSFGEVWLVEIGATCVGSVIHTAPPGAPVAKGDERGYFRFGGSCVITLFEPGMVKFEADLLEQSGQGRELFAKVGDVAGRLNGQPK